MSEHEYTRPSDEIADLRQQLYKQETEVSHLNELYEEARLKLIAEIEAEAQSEDFRETLAEGYDACFEAVDELALELHEGVEDPLIPGPEGLKAEHTEVEKQLGSAYAAIICALLDRIAKIEQELADARDQKETRID